MVMAGGAAKAVIVEQTYWDGKYSRGKWYIDDDHILHVEINGPMKDYGEGKAPWYQYRDQIYGIHIGPNTSSVGRNGFFGLNHVKSVTGGEKVKSVAMYSFEKCGYGIPLISLPICDYVGECAFAGTSVRALSLPMVKTWKASAVVGAYESIKQVNVAKDYTKCQMADLGSAVKELRPGSMMVSDMVFISNPTPPNWERLYQRGEAKSIDIMAAVFSLGLSLIGDYESVFPERQYEYPFGSNSNVRVVVPEESLQDYIDYYHDKKGTERGYMMEDFTGEHKKHGDTYPSGKLVAGAPIYKDGTLIGGWYVEGKELHVHYVDGKMPRYQYNVPWKKGLGKVEKLVFHSVASDSFEVPENAFIKGFGLDGITEIEFRDIGKMVVGDDAFLQCKDLKSIKGEHLETRVGHLAFKDCTSLKEFDGTISFVGNFAFQSCEKLDTVDLSKCDSVLYGSFLGCSRLNTDVKEVKFMAMDAFRGTGIRKVNLKSCETLQNEVFASSSVEELTMPSNRVYENGDLGYRAFANCSKLTDVYVSIGIGKDATPSDFFKGLILNRIILHAKPEVYAAGYEKDEVWGAMRTDMEVTYPVNDKGWSLERDGFLTLSDIGAMTDKSLQRLKSFHSLVNKVEISEGNTEIPDNMFADFEEIISVKIPPTCTSIGVSAFARCKKLRYIGITGVEVLGSQVFEDCSSLETINLGLGLKKAGNYIFRHCIHLKKIGNKDAVPAAVNGLTFADIGSDVYDSRRGSQFSAPESEVTGQAAVTLEVPDEFVTNYIVDNNWGKFHIQFADGRGRWVSAGRFGDGTWILYEDSVMVVAADKGPGRTYEESNSVKLGFGRASDPNSVISRTRRVEFTGNMKRLEGGFHGFPNLESVSLCPSIRALDGSFEQCPKLTDINLESIDTIGEWTFSQSGVGVVSLPNAKYIARGAFRKCKHLKLVTLGQPCVIKQQAFLYCDSLLGINLSEANLDDASECFNSCYRMKTVAFTGKYLPENIFANCFALRRINLGENLDSINANAFWGSSKLDTIFCANPTPPAMPWGKRKVGNELQDAQAFFDRNLKNIHLFVPADLVLQYKKADVWKDMTIETDTAYVDNLLPTGGAIADKGTWLIDEEGTLTLDYEGSAWSVEVGGSNVRWHDLLAPWMPFIKRVVISDRVAQVPSNMAGEHEPTNSADVQSVELGSHITRVNDGSLNYSGLHDVYCYAESCPVASEKSFDWDAIAKNDATLHVVTSAGVLERYQASKTWSRFPRIVADLESRMPAELFSAKNAEGLDMWFRITSEADEATGTAGTCETYVNEVIGFAVEYDSYKQYDKLTIPATVSGGSASGKTYTVTAIGDNSFYACSNFKSFILPQTIERIGVNAFRGSNGMYVEDFTLPASVKLIAENAFEMWTGLKRMTVEGQTPPVTDGNALNTYYDPEMGPQPMLLVPSGARAAWDVSPWNKWFLVYDPNNKEFLTYKVKPGTKFNDYYGNNGEYMCIEGLKALGLITVDDEEVGREWDEIAESWTPIYGQVMRNKAGKRLLYCDADGLIHIYDGVTPADNISYEFKTADYETMAWTTGRNIDLFKGAAIVFPGEVPQADIYFTATNEDGLDISYRVIDLEKMTCEVKADPEGYSTTAVDNWESVVHIPSTVTVTVPDISTSSLTFTVTGIAPNAFNSMSSLMEVKLPQTTHNIGEDAFGYCESLQNVYIDRETPPTLLDNEGFVVEGNNLAFEDIGSPAGSDPEMGGMGGAMLHVPTGCAEAYNFEPWTIWFTWGIQDDIRVTAPGDVNGDGNVDVADIATIISVMASSVGSGSPAATAADVNSDGVVDVADIAAVISIMAANARRLQTP